MKTMRLTRWHIITPIIIWGAAFLALSAYNYNPFQILNIIGFLFIAIVPGFLTMLALDLEGLSTWGYAIFVLAFSLLELMIIALLGNTFLPFAGILRPLDKLPIMLEMYLLVAIFASIVWLRAPEIHVPVKAYVFYERGKDAFFSFFPIIFVALSAFGAIRLNNGADNIFTMVMLGAMGLYTCFLIGSVNDLDENATATGLFFMALSLLLMTSLRGWYITGHDIQNEYKVFELAKNNGLWSMAAYRDAYNACLSITILPTLISNLLSIPDPYIYKIFFQVFFALSPVLVYTIARNWTTRRIALLSTIFFMGFPTFFTDMPFLIRQETAFIFYGLMLYIIFHPTLPLEKRRWLFMFMGIGVILSHYSTTYTVLIVFGLTVLFRPIFVPIFNYFRGGPERSASAIITHEDGVRKKPAINIAMIGVLFVLSFLWTTIITQTSSSVTSVLSQTFSAVQQGFAGDNRSIDVNTLLSFSRPNQDQELQDYVTQDVNPERAAAPAGTYFPASTYEQYPLVALGSETVPVTPLGQFLTDHGIDTTTGMTDFGQLLEKLIEILVPLGMLYLLFSNKIIEKVDVEIYLISFFCLVFIGLNLALPVISTEYGIFRAMQQSMFIIGPIIVAGAIALGNGIKRVIPWFRRIFAGERFAIGLAAIFFFYSTYFLPYLFGGGLAVLHLSNDGSYYDHYLIQGSEVYGVEWLSNISAADPADENGVRLVIQADRYSQYKFASISSLDSSNNIFPGLIDRAGYVFLDPITVTKQRATTVYNSDPVTYTYPLQFLEDNKDLIYNNGGSEVYR